MKPKRRMLTLVLAATLACSTLSAGCSPVGFFGPNFTLSLVIPLGLSGTPGLFNPFGIVQSLVNSLLGAVAASGGGTTGSAGTGGSGGSIVPIIT